MSQATNYMSHWTAEGSRRSNRNAGKTPSFDHFPPPTTMDENPNPLLDTEDVEGISFATDTNVSTIDDPFTGNDLTTDTADNIAILQQSTQSEDHHTASYNSTPIMLKGATKNKQAPPPTGVPAQTPPQQLQASNFNTFNTPKLTTTTTPNESAKKTKGSQPTNQTAAPNGFPTMQMNGVNGPQAPYWPNVNLFQPSASAGPQFPFLQHQLPHPFAAPPPTQYFNHGQQQQPFFNQQQPAAFFTQQQPPNDSQSNESTKRIAALEQRLKDLEKSQQDQFQVFASSISTTINSKNQELLDMLSSFKASSNITSNNPTNQQIKSVPEAKILDLTTNDNINDNDNKSTQQTKLDTNGENNITTTIDNKTITIKLDSRKKDVKLNFKQFRAKKDDYKTWKDGCLSRIHTSSDISETATSIDNEGKIHLNPEMDDNESRIIVRETLDHMDDSAHFTTGTSILQIQAASEI